LINWFPSLTRLFYFVGIASLFYWIFMITAGNASCIRESFL
jgi:hypothetical protein